jgi:hypothetical protein
MIHKSAAVREGTRRPQAVWPGMVQTMVWRVTRLVFGISGRGSATTTFEFGRPPSACVTLNVPVTCNLRKQGVGQLTRTLGVWPTPRRPVARGRLYIKHEILIKLIVASRNYKWRRRIRSRTTLSSDFF